MYEIDFNTCTARDVIARSMTCHPSLMRDELLNLSKQHEAWLHATTTASAGAKRGGRTLRDACAKSAAWVEYGDLDAIMADFSARIASFEVASRLQLIPRATRADIRERA